MASRAVVTVPSGSGEVFYDATVNVEGGRLIVHDGERDRSWSWEPGEWVSVTTEAERETRVQLAPPAAARLLRRKAREYDDQASEHRRVHGDGSMLALAHRSVAAELRQIADEVDRG